MRRPILRTIVIAVVVGALLGSAPTSAIETAAFGLDVAEKSDDARLHIPIAAGESSTGQILVWNKQATPLRLRLTVSPAVVDRDGKASLGGDDADPVSWVALDETVALGPEERRRLTVEVRAPRKLDARTRTVAIIAEPAAAEGEAARAVVQRLALTTFLEPDEGSLIAGLGPFPWIAMAVLVVVATALVRSAARRRQAGTSPPIG